MTMKEIVNYLICFALIFPVIIMLLSDSILWMLVGIVYTGCLCVSSVAYPSLWRSFVKTNIRICKTLGCW